MYTHDARKPTNKLVLEILAHVTCYTFGLEIHLNQRLQALETFPGIQWGSIEFNWGRKSVCKIVMFTRQLSIHEQRWLFLTVLYINSSFGVICCFMQSKDRTHPKM